MTSLGFMLNEEKSVVIPTHVIAYLGNIIDSEKMIVYLPVEKKEKIKKECLLLINSKEATIKQVAKVIGLLVSAFSAVEYGRLFYMELEMGKIFGLKKSCGNFDAIMEILPSMKSELMWWYLNVDSQIRRISMHAPDVPVQTDSSTQGWGIVYEGQEFGGRWTEEEKKYHINVLEIMAIWFALQALSNKLAGLHIQILSDSSTAVCYIENMGSTRSLDCNKIACKIWMWCYENSAWISISHIPGKTNMADAPSRQFNDKIEWELNDQVFEQICKIWQKPCIDLFASRSNRKLKTYCAWKPDPSAAFIDAFTVNWQQFKLVYIFAPFSMINCCVRKIQENQAQAIIIVPLRETQIWFSPLMKLLVEVPVILPKTKHLLTLQHSEQSHPLADKLVLIACRVSGVCSQAGDFLLKQQTLCPHGAAPQKRDTKLIYKTGYNIVVRNKLINFRLL